MKIDVIGSQSNRKNWRHEMDKLAFFVGVRNGLIITGIAAIVFYVIYSFVMAIAGR